MSKTKKISGKTVTSYDGIAKRLLDNMDDERMITFINHTFSRAFRKDSAVTRLATETYDSETKQRRCDYFVKIDDDMFLIEIQSYEDDEMAIRIFEYGSRGAVLHTRKITEDDTIDIQLPEPVVFYLRKGDKVRDRLSVRIHRSGSDEEYRYEAKVVYVEDYDMDGLIETGMYPLVPFYPMRYEKILNKNHSEEDENSILRDFEASFRKITAAMKSQKFGAEYYLYIKESMIKVFGGVVERMKNSGKMKSVKEARAVMQRIVDEPIEMFDIFKALEDSREEGIEQGKAEGKFESIKVMKYLTKNYTEEKPEDELIGEMTEKLEISIEEAREYLKKYLED